MRRFFACFLGLTAALSACATSRGSLPVEAPGTAPISPAAKRLYTVGEIHFAKGEYDNAVALWRHVLLQLPPGPEADEPRHKLILRMGYAQLTAWTGTGDRTYLTNAARMLNRYVAKHEALFGDGPQAVAQRGEVYGLIHEVETRLEQADPKPEAPPEERPVELTGVGGQPQLDDDHEGEVLDGDLHREVVVDTRARTDVQDSTVRGRLATDFSTGWAGPVLTAAEPVVFHGPRPLVRVAGIPKVVGDVADRDAARRAAWRVVRAVRPSLEDCYDDAFARSAVPLTDARVQATVEADGNVSGVRIVEGGLVDVVGDVCLLERLDSVQIVPDGRQAVARIELPLRFFYQDKAVGSMYFNPGEPNQAPMAMPGIDVFAR